MKRLIAITAVAGFILGAALGPSFAATDSTRVPVKATEGPDIRAKVEPRGMEGPDVRAKVDPKGAEEPDVR